METRHRKRLQEKRVLTAIRPALATLTFLSLAFLLSAAGEARAQAVAADPILPCCPFQKGPRFESRVNADAFDGAQSVTQSYYDLIQRYDPRDPNPDKLPVFLAEIDYSLEASLAEGNGRVYNSISSLPFRPGGPRFKGDTSMSADYFGLAASLVADEQFSFSGFEGNPQQGSAIWGGMEFSTELIRGNASSHVQFDTVTRQFEGSYLGNAVGAAEIAVNVGEVSGETGVNSSSQSYSGAISVEGDYEVRYTVSGGPSGGGPFCGW